MFVLWSSSPTCHLGFSRENNLINHTFQLLNTKLTTISWLFCCFYFCFGFSFFFLNIPQLFIKKNPTKQTSSYKIYTFFGVTHYTKEYLSQSSSSFSLAYILLLSSNIRSYTLYLNSHFVSLKTTVQVFHQAT